METEGERGSSSRPTKLALARMALAGDRIALNELVRRQEVVLDRLLRARGERSGLRPRACELLLQRIHSTRPTLEEPRTEPGVSLWLCRLLEAAHGAGSAQALERGGPRADPSSASTPSERLDALVARLSIPRRDVVLLRDYLGASWEEVSLELGGSLRQVRRWHVGARVQVGRWLREG